MRKIGITSKIIYMKNLVFIVFFFISCGTIGHVQFYNFNASKYEVEKELLNIINKDSLHSVPVKWADINKDPGPIELIYLYFSQSPEEMYQVGFTGTITQWKNSSYCKLSLDGVFNGDHWGFKKELSYNEMKRIRERFEKEILSKIKYGYCKSS